LPVHRDLPGPRHEESDRGVEELLLDEDVAAPRQRTVQQRAVDDAGVVRGHDGRAGGRQMARTVYTGVRPHVVEEPSHTAGPCRAPAVDVLGADTLATARLGHRRPSWVEVITDSTAATVSSMPRALESMVTTPSAAVWNEETVESSASRRRASSRGAARAVSSAAPCRSRARRASRACSSATSRMRTSASGATTVVMSRPSATTPGPAATAVAMRSRWRRLSSVRTSRLVATLDTTAVS